MGWAVVGEVSELKLRAMQLAGYVEIVGVDFAVCNANGRACM